MRYDIKISKSRYLRAKKELADAKIYLCEAEKQEKELRKAARREKKDNDWEELVSKFLGQKELCPIVVSRLKKRPNWHIEKCGNDLDSLSAKDLMCVPYLGEKGQAKIEAWKRDGNSLSFISASN